MCPTDYHGSAPFSPYIYELGAGLHPDIDVFYTGRAICSPEIGADEVSAFAQAIRRPPLIWDNYPVNDLKMAGELHIGAVVGRDPTLEGITRGICANLMLQVEASKIPLLTYAEYLRDPTGYAPERSWANAIAEVAGESSAESLRLFAENSLYSCLGVSEAEPLQTYVDAVLGALKSGERVSGSPAVEALKAYLAALDEASYHLKFRMDNLKLRQELLPWIEKLDQWVWLGKFTLQALESHARGDSIEPLVGRIRELRADALAHPKRIGGTVMLPLVDWALEKFGSAQRLKEPPSHA
jgi:hyaluronoglucosaminidase